MVGFLKLSLAAKLRFARIGKPIEDAAITTYGCLRFATAGRIGDRIFKECKMCRNMGTDLLIELLFCL